MGLDPKPRDFGDEWLQAVVGFVCGALVGIPVGLFICSVVWVLLPMGDLTDGLSIIVIASMLIVGVYAAAMAYRKGPAFWEDLKALL